MKIPVLFKRLTTLIVVTLTTFLNAYGADYTDSQGVIYTYINSTTCYVDESSTSINKTSITIPSRINGRTVVKIGKRAFFYSHKIVSVTLPQTITEIEDKAFEGCDKINNIIIPNSVVLIGKEAFEYCESLKTITLSSNLTTIRDYAFSHCEALSSITIPASVTSIGNNAFIGCGALTSIKVEANNTVYDSRNDCNAIIETTSNKLLRGCSNTIIPNTIKQIDSYAFDSCLGLTSINIPESVTYISGFSLHGCNNLKIITVDTNNSVYDSRDNCNAVVRKSTNEIQVGCIGTNFVSSITGVSSYAFYGLKSLTTLSLPPNIKNIGDNAFYYCEGLQEVTILNVSPSIGKEAFKSCNALRTINSYIPNPTEISEDVFLLYKSSYATEDHSEDVYNNAVLYVPIGSKSKYEERAGWKKFKNIVEKFDVQDVSPVDDLQAKLDAIAEKNLPWYKVETIELPTEGVLVDKPLYVRNGCRVQLTGGPLNISKSIQNDFCISIDSKSRLEFKDITIDFMRYSLDGNKYIFYNQGELGFEENIEYKKVPYFTNNTGECLIYCAANSTFECYNDKRLYTGGLSVIKAEEGANIHHWRGVLESVSVPVIDGLGRVVIGAKVIGSGFDKMSIIKAKEFQTGEGRHVITDFKVGATYITADIINLNYLDNNGLFEGGGENIVIGKHGNVSGLSSVPTLFLKKDAYISLYGGIMKVNWDLDAEWGDFTLGQVIVENVESISDFEKIIFHNMPDDREAYYDETTKTVKLRERSALPTTGCDEDWLQKKLDEIAAQKPSEPVELTICEDGITLTKSILVAKDCKAVLTGGPITSEASIVYRYGGEGVFMVYGELGFHDISLTFNNDAKNDGSIGYFWLGDGTLKMQEKTIVNTMNGTVVGGWGRYELKGGTIFAGGNEMVIASNIEADISGSVTFIGAQTYCNGRLSLDLTFSEAGYVQIPTFRVNDIYVTSTLDIYAPLSTLPVYLYKDATINTEEGGIAVLTVAGEWDKMTPGRAIVTSTSITQKDYEGMTFDNLPTNLKAEFVPEMHQVQLVTVEERNIQNDLDGLMAGDQTTPIVIDVASDAVSMLSQPATVSHANVTFNGMQDGSASRGRLHFAKDQTLTVSQGSLVTLTNLDVTGEGGSECFVVKGQLVIGENVHVSDFTCFLCVQNGGSVGVSGPLVSTVTLRYVNGLTDGQTVIVGTDGYQLTEQDLSSVRVEDCELKLDMTNNRIVAVNPTSIREIEKSSSEMSGGYYDLSGRHVLAPRQGVYIMKSEGKTRKVYVK